MDMLITLVLAWTLVGGSGLFLLIIALCIPSRAMDASKFLQVVATAFALCLIGSVVVVGTISVYHLVVWNQVPPTTLEVLYRGEM